MLDNALDLVQVGSVAIGATAVVVTFRGIRDQLWLATFTEYTRRYSEIMSALPFEARRPDGSFDLSAEPVEVKQRYLSTMREYFNLCSEELYLFRRGRVDRDTWDIWKAGIGEVARFPCFSVAWNTLRTEYLSFASFVEFMDDLVARQLDTPASEGGELET